MEHTNHRVLYKKIGNQLAHFFRGGGGSACICFFSFTLSCESQKTWNIGVLLAHRLRRWSNSKPTLAQRLMFAGNCYPVPTLMSREITLFHWIPKYNKSVFHLTVKYHQCCQTAFSLYTNLSSCRRNPFHLCQFFPQLLTAKSLPFIIHIIDESQQPANRVVFISYPSVLTPTRV